jgi:FlaA1/EpsC-like NDP-sugar epimerase
MPAPNEPALSLSPRFLDSPVEPALAARLLGRTPVAVEPSRLRRVVANRRVLVTGGWVGSTSGQSSTEIIVPSAF